MFDWTWIEELGGNETADELARSRDLVLAAEAGQFLLAAHWADLHAPEFVDEVRGELPGMPRAMRSWADGCPEIDEFAGAELAALLGRSTAAGEQLVRDAVTLRHRHPALWQALKRGEARVWLAAKVAQRCVAAALSQERAQWVDAQTTPYLMTLPVRRFLDLVEAKIIEADPAAAEERARARSLARFVRAGMRDEDGLRTLFARAHAGDVTYLVAVLDRMAAILGDQGDPDPLDARRATALRILANPARALALLTEATLEALDDGVEPTALGASDVHPSMELHPVPDAGGPEEAADPTLLRGLLAALEGFDASALDPVTVLHVHLTDAALAARSGVVRVEELGPATLREVRDWLTHPTSPEQVRHQVRLRPVLDATSVVPVDRYEIPAAMAELLAVRCPAEVFPFGTLSGRRADKDHVVAYRAGALGQTRPQNLAPLGRRHHRIKTFGRWLLRHPEPGVYWWRTRHGHWFRVDAAGTHHHGRDPGLDQAWADPERAAA